MKDERGDGRGKDTGAWIAGEPRYLPTAMQIGVTGMTRLYNRTLSPHHFALLKSGLWASVTCQVTHRTGDTLSQVREKHAKAGD